MATHFDYNPKKITESELDEKVKDLFANTDFSHGDCVKLKSDSNAPAMVITEITVGTQEIMFQKFARKFIIAHCTWFNKSKQEYSTSRFSVLCLAKV